MEGKIHISVFVGYVREVCYGHIHTCLRGLLHVR